MAIRIPILTSFDPKGLKQANAAFAGLQTSMGSLARNFATAGVVIAGAFTVIGKGLADAAESQKVLAQTEAVLRSTGTTANGTATQIAEMAASLQKSTAFSDEAILSGANLLLTFKNIQNQAGEGNDIFDQTTQAMLDVARAMGTDASGEAIRLGKALNDPIGGISALTRVGIQFTDQQKEQIEALTLSGDLMGAQKIILAELQSQFGGSAAAYAQTFAGQVEGLNNDLNDLSEEIGFMVMPAVQGMIREFRNLIPIIGPQLKAALESVDWASLVKSIVDLTTFLIYNIETIAKVVAAIFILNTAFKLMAVASGIAKVAIALQAWFTAQLATGMTLATVATNIFSAALRLVPFAAVATGLFILVDYFTKSEEAIKRTLPGLGDFERKAIAAADTGTRFVPIVNAFRLIATEILNATGILDKFNQARTGGRVTTSSSYDEFEARRARAMNDRLNKAVLDNKLSKIVTPDFTSLLDSLSTVANVPVFDTSALDQQQAALTQALTTANDEQSEALKDELAMLDKRKSAYESFTDAVKSLFSQIKNSILSSFDLPTLGNSVNSITRNISKLLERTKGFARSISQLSGMGLNSTLLQQVIQAGPMAGSQLAAALVGGGSGFISQINRAYGEFGDLAGGIAGTGTTAAFGGQQTINNYSIEVTGGLATGSDVGRAVVNAIRDFERQSGSAWRA